MSTESMPQDPREQPVDVRVDTDAPYIHLVQGPLPSGAAQASILRAKQARDRERDEAIQADLDAHPTALLEQQCRDTLQASAVAERLTHYRPEDAVDAAAVAVRLCNPDWERMARYGAAEMVCGALRNALRGKAVEFAFPEADLRRLADKLAGLAHQERVRVLTGERTVSPREWAECRLGLKQFGETL